jgi:enamine deaminase RidA (YjgF/YER057c/UK114 family)
MVTATALPSRAEERLKALRIDLPRPPSPLGAYVEAVRSGNLLFLSGVLPVESGKPRYSGTIGRGLSPEEGREAARLAAVNAIAVAREHLGSLDRVTRVIRLGVALVATGDFIDPPKTADGASELLRDVLGEARMSTRIVLGVASLPLGVPVELELIFEVKDHVDAEGEAR